jgi:Trk K+ transport system NAD-binding subunit
LASLQQAGGTGAAGTDDVTVVAGSALDGRMLREAGLPADVLITTMQRQRDLLVPDGSTRLRPGDRLVVIGSAEAIEQVRSQAGRGAD